MRITDAPILRSLTNEREWFQWFSSVGGALLGRWGQERRSLELINLDPPEKELLNYKGRECSFLLYWESEVEFNNSSINLETNPDKADPTFWPGMLQVWEGSTLVGGATIEDRTITIPDFGVLAGRVTLQGTAMIKTRDPRGVV